MNGPSGKSQDTHMTKLAYSSGNGDLQNEKFQEIKNYEAIKSMKSARIYMFWRIKIVSGEMFTN